MWPRAPNRWPRSPKKRPAALLRRRRPPSNRPAEPRISPPRSRRSPHSPKPSSAAMASRRHLQKTQPTLVPNDVGAEASTGNENLLIFQLAGGSFGLRQALVAEIIRLPELVRVPLVPPSLIGVANLRGIVLPVVSLRRLMNLPDATADESTWVIVMRGNAPVGFVVDRVDALRVLPATQIEHD